MSDDEADRALVDRVVADHLREAWAYGMRPPEGGQVFPDLGHLRSEWHAGRAAILKCMPLPMAAEVVRRDLLDGLGQGGPTLRDLVAKLMDAKDQPEGISIANEIVRRFDR